MACYSWLWPTWVAAGTNNYRCLIKQSNKIPNHESSLTHWDSVPFHTVRPLEGPSFSYSRKGPAWTPFLSEPITGLSHRSGLGVPSQSLTYRPRSQGLVVTSQGQANRDLPLSPEGCLTYLVHVLLPPHTWGPSFIKIGIKECQWFVSKLNIWLPCDPAIPLLGICPKKVK